MEVEEYIKDISNMIEDKLSIDMDGISQLGLNMVLSAITMEPIFILDIKFNEKNQFITYTANRADIDRISEAFTYIQREININNLNK